MVLVLLVCAVARCHRHPDRHWYLSSIGLVDRSIGFRGPFDLSVVLHDGGFAVWVGVRMHHYDDHHSPGRHTVTLVFLTTALTTTLTGPMAMF